jgi:hypothetical protein
MIGYRGRMGAQDVWRTVARSRQVCIELVMEALLIVLSYPDVTSDLKCTMPVQAVAGR